MSLYKSYLHHYAPGSHSTHHHYYAGHHHYTGPPRIPSRNYLPTPPGSPREPETEWIRSEQTHARRLHLSEFGAAQPPSTADATRATLEERAPSVYAHLGSAFPPPTTTYLPLSTHPGFERRRPSMPAWWLNAARDRGRGRASQAAHDTHVGMESDRAWLEEFTRGYDAGFDEAYHLGVRHGGEEGGADMRLAWSAGQRLERKWQADAMRGLEVGFAAPAGPAAFGMGRKMGRWQRSEARQYAEVMAMLDTMQRKTFKKDKREYIRLRDGEKAWVRRKKEGKRKVRFGWRGVVNDVEWVDKSKVYEKSGEVRHERRVHCL